jgi:hypothetical protein
MRETSRLFWVIALFCTEFGMPMLVVHLTYQQSRFTT